MKRVFNIWLTVLKSLTNINFALRGDNLYLYILTECCFATGQSVFVCGESNCMSANSVWKKQNKKPGDHYCQD